MRRLNCWLVPTLIHSRPGSKRRSAEFCVVARCVLQLLTLAPQIVSDSRRIFPPLFVKYSDIGFVPEYVLAVFVVCRVCGVDGRAVAQGVLFGRVSVGHLYGVQPVCLHEA